MRIILTLGLAGAITAAVAGMPDAPGNMPNTPMPKFNFFTPQGSVLRKPKAIQKHAVAIHHKKDIKTKQHRVRYVMLYPGSLKANIIRLARDTGWKHIIWQSDDDFHWIGKVRVAAKNLPDILNNILKDYPLQANFYTGNHVLVIIPRTIQT